MTGYETLDLSDLEIWKSKTAERAYLETPEYFFKRELHSSERRYRDDGTLVKSQFEHMRARLENEFRILKFLRAKAPRIPIPEAKLMEVNGLLTLRIARAPGTELGELDDAKIDQAVAQVTKEMEEDILPTLQALKSNELGGLNEQDPALLPPPFMLPSSRTYKGQMRKISVDSADFVLCHNDLRQSNIFVDPETFKITCIIDWEYAGFYPSDFELHMWKYRHPVPYDELGGGKRLWAKLVALGAADPTDPADDSD